jgi:hypothetical protein
MKFLKGLKGAGLFILACLTPFIMILLAGMALLAFYLIGQVLIPV